ncbi:diguanylate phosphodiesterase [Planococcus plakortidis]|uniref:Diguanylate phosphodiesterase n=1 Tax=Planococcus plakortidis TaxID=1038856 RepID=A0A1C7EB69_9BACL|nr:EAL domain-containing protein [Planococcus plakortidis]ANU20978.1 diguanylate phosphodiesterase [Planococcus plakortidis]
MNCNNCSVQTLTFDIRLSGELNQSIIPIAIDHLERQGLEVTLKDSRIRMCEFGAREFLSFCEDLLEMEAAEFRINQERYQPIAGMRHVFDMEWIDEVIQNERIVSHFQPIVDQDRNIFAYEMLARFHDADGQVIYPNAIFPAAKSRGRLYALDRVCRMTAVRAASRLSGEKAFINFIPTSIYSPEFCLRSTIDLAHQTGVDPNQLVFEVVESEKVDDLEHLKHILGYYKSRGFQYALDDVGEGYSTAEVLGELKPHFMKLDMKYVDGVAGDTAKQAVATSFLEKAQAVGSTPLAEGIESEEDFLWLKAQGYELFQGYYFGKPAAAPLATKTAS